MPPLSTRPSAPPWILRQQLLLRRWTEDTPSKICKAGVSPSCGGSGRVQIWRRCLFWPCCTCPKTGGKESLLPLMSCKRCTTAGSPRRPRWLPSWRPSSSAMAPSDRSGGLRSSSQERWTASALLGTTTPTMATM
ncbi:unnamed protein product, partial [Ectocarpus sp. 12 AP-2014]